ncbi:hypothetical protein [Halomonas organivorans]|uniref:Uncharacterized protein n=1 Tax=Halomonas organivorans TaxID=257772 RepID=A0A7W5C195_9GAMM|nr:hypothetical protein [Halomonas organivorans]MBB3142771.1 hypothetical protein [Halomonas organivorans]
MDWSKLITHDRDEHSFSGAYQDHEIEIEREDADDRWYIIVTAPCGMRDYDGWWWDEGAPLDEAIEEAVRGAMIDEETVE